MFEANCSSAWFWSKLQHASFSLILMPEKSVMSVGCEDSSVSETWRSVARLGKEGGPRRWSANSLLETAQRILICDFPVLHSMVCASINSTNPCTGSSIACHSVIHIWPQFINLQFTSFPAVHFIAVEATWFNGGNVSLMPYAGTMRAPCRDKCRLRKAALLQGWPTWLRTNENRLLVQVITSKVLCGALLCKARGVLMRSCLRKRFHKGAPRRAYMHVLKRQKHTAHVDITPGFLLYKLIILSCIKNPSIPYSFRFVRLSLSSFIRLTCWGECKICLLTYEDLQPCEHAASITESLLRTDGCLLGIYLIIHPRLTGPPPSNCAFTFVRSFA